MSDDKRLMVFIQDDKKLADDEELDSGYAVAWIDESGHDVVPPSQKIWFEIKDSSAVFKDSGTNKTSLMTSASTGATDLVYFHSTGNEAGGGELYAYWDTDTDANNQAPFTFISANGPPPPPPPPPPKVTGIDLFVIANNVPLPIVQAIVHTSDGLPATGIPVNFGALPIDAGGGGHYTVDISPNPSVTALVSDKGANPDPVDTILGVATTTISQDDVDDGEIAALVVAWVGPDATNTSAVFSLPVLVNFL